jgi:sterol desaturase/sphingolipid hydroxylase (fatty acid hydroxylase superfamily)
MEESRAFAVAIPFLVVMMAAELWIGRRSGRRLYRFHETVANAACGGMQLLAALLFPAALVLPYLWVYEHRLWQIRADSVWAWIGAFLMMDLAYYFYHRLSHRVNALWAVHVVHHQSREMNTSVALRIGFGEAFLVAPFFLPLALIGVPPAMALTARIARMLYTVWIHTRVIGRLGILEWVFNTPSHHRVHHGVNPQYLDKNYGGIFIVWDRLFGTFEPEKEAPRYGTVQPFAGFNPWWANVVGWSTLLGVARRATRFSDRVRIWFMPPEWMPAGLDAAAIPATAGLPLERRAASKRDSYVAVHCALLIGLLSWLLWSRDILAESVVWVWATLLIASYGVMGGLADGRGWAWPLEAARLTAVAAAVAGLAVFGA